MCILSSAFSFFVNYSQIHNSKFMYDPHSYFKIVIFLVKDNSFRFKDADLFFVNLLLQKEIYSNGLSKINRERFSKFL